MWPNGVEFATRSHRTTSTEVAVSTSMSKCWFKWWGWIWGWLCFTGEQMQAVEQGIPGLHGSAYTDHWCGFVECVWEVAAWFCSLFHLFILPNPDLIQRIHVPFSAIFSSRWDQSIHSSVFRSTQQYPTTIGLRGTYIILHPLANAQTDCSEMLRVHVAIILHHFAHRILGLLAGLSKALEAFRAWKATKKRGGGTSWTAGAVLFRMPSVSACIRHQLPFAQCDVSKGDAAFMCGI